LSTSARFHRFLGIIGMLLLLATPAFGDSPKKETRAPAPTQEELPAALGQYISLKAPTVPPQELVGMIFGVPVSKGNYNFAKAVAVLFPRPWGASELPPEEQEKILWESLILHYESYRRGIEATEEELGTMADNFLKANKQGLTRRSDPQGYQRWVKATFHEEVELFENQLRFLIQIRRLKDQVLQQAQVTVTQEEMREEFLNEKNHVGGEMVTFDTKEEADLFYARFKDPKGWEQMKAKGEPKVRPVSLMTLEAYMDLWKIPKDQMVAFHGMEIGSVGPPMPFGRQWCVYRLLEKRTGDLKDFPKEQEDYHRRVEMKKKYASLNRWIEDLKASAQTQVF